MIQAILSRPSSWCGLSQSYSINFPTLFHVSDYKTVGKLLLLAEATGLGVHARVTGRGLMT